MLIAVDLRLEVLQHQRRVQFISIIDRGSSRESKNTVTYLLYFHSK